LRTRTRRGLWVVASHGAAYSDKGKDVARCNCKEPNAAVSTTVTASPGGFTVFKRLRVQGHIWLAALVDLDGEGLSQDSWDAPSSHREQADQLDRAKKDDARRDAKRFGPNVHQPRWHIGC
jgi:hypothetical protein